MSDIRNWKSDLKIGEEENFLKLRFKYYKRWFGPNVASIEKGELADDLIGIDWKINMKCGKSILIDEKLTTNFEQIWLEEFSDIHRPEKQSWLTKENYVTDYIAYWIGHNRCKMYDYLTFQNTWFKNCKNWKSNYEKLNIRRTEPHTESGRGCWTTLCWAVPIELFEAEYYNTISVSEIKKKVEWFKED